MDDALLTIHVLKESGSARRVHLDEDEGSR